MSITGNATLNRVVRTLTNFELFFNINAQSDSNLVNYETFLDDVSQGVTNISPQTKQTSLIVSGIFATNIGFHTFGVLFTDASGQSEYYTQTIYLDHTVPVLNNFSLNRIARDEYNNYILHFDVDISDETGISKISLKNITNSEVSSIYTEYSTADFVGQISINLPISYTNSFKNIILEYEDYSGNKGISSPISILLLNNAPTINKSTVKKVVKSDTHYEVTVEIDVSQNYSQYITDYSLELNPISNWKSTLINGLNPIFERILYIPLAEPEGNKTIHVSIRDNYRNTREETISFYLDKISPEGTIGLDFAEKIGDNYYANVKFYATDAGKILGYGYQIDGSNSLLWNYVNTPSQVFQTNETIQLGPDGERTLYVQYSDMSGNLSPIYNLNLGIDTSNPDCSFLFLEGNLDSNGDYSAKFHLLATDDINVQFIKLYGYDANTNSVVTSYGNNWIRISETRTYDDVFEIVIPKTQQEGELVFYFQAKDIYGNESPLRSANVIFDKNAPTINTFEIDDAIKTSSYHRIIMKTNAIDNKGINAYRHTYNDINLADWNPIEPTVVFDPDISLDIPISEVGLLKTFKLQVKDIFGNVSNTATYPIQLDQIGPTANVSFAGAALTSNSYILDFLIEADDVGTGNVYFYSITANDSTNKIWKRFKNPNKNLSEVVSYEFPRTNEGLHTFYIRVADSYKNESPVYSVDYDLDSIEIVGGITLAGIEKQDANTYYANVELYAVDNRRVDSYSLNGGPWTEITPPVNTYIDHLLLPIGGSAGPRTFFVKYRDSFYNTSNTYVLNFDLDNEDPSANVYASGVSSNSTHYDINLRLDTQDNGELDRFKFWYEPNGEPNTWSYFPNGKNSYEVFDTFSVPRIDLTPKFEWKVVDFFQNEIYGYQEREIVSTPPGTVSMSLNNIVYTPTTTTVYVDYLVTAANNSTIDKLDVTVNRTSAYVRLDNFQHKTDNLKVSSGTFSYTFSKTKTYAKFDVFAISDYGFNGPTSTTTYNFDSAGPYANATFIGAFEDNYDYILQLRIEGSDFGSGLHYVDVVVDSFPLTKTFTFDIQNTNVLDDIFNIRIDQSHTNNLANLTIYIYDIKGNVSSPVYLPNIYLDRFRPEISNIVLNNNSTYNSPYVGVNSLNVPFRFEADDLSFITHYTYSKFANVAFDSTWTAVASNTTHISISETINLGDLNFEQGLQTLYVHAKDKFNNIGTAGVNFEFDNIPPVVKLKFSGRIDREIIGTQDYFKIPYVLDYDDNYSEVYFKYRSHSYGGDNYPIIKEAYGFLQSNVIEDYYYLPVDNQGDTKISIALEDRLRNKSNAESFTVHLENIPPVIHSSRINKEEDYTTNKDVYIELDMSDNVGVMEVLFSKSNTVTWDNPNWQPIPFAPRQTLLNTFTADLDALGFVEGTCNVHMFVKDFCQNIGSSSNTIIYDKNPPVITNFSVTNINRTLDNFEISLSGSAYDIVSGWNEYFISQSVTNKIFDIVPGGPIIGNTPNTITQTEYITVRDGGLKKIYFQTKDKAGNISEKANVEIYIDNTLPVASYFSSDNGGSKYYLNRSNTEFRYIVTDDYAISSIDYSFDNSTTLHNLIGYDESDFIKYNAQTFNADFSTLTDGEHTIYLNVTDFYKNVIKVPYKFYLDSTQPTINKFEVKEVKPAFNGNALNYDVELDIDLFDNTGIKYFELYDNDELVTTVNVNNTVYTGTPTILSILDLSHLANTANVSNSSNSSNGSNSVNISNTISANTELHNYSIRIVDYALNDIDTATTKLLHDGTNTEINNFIVHGNTTYTTTIVSNELFEANISAPVDITAYALTIDATLDYDSVFWIPINPASNNIMFSNTMHLSNFAVNTLTGTSKIYLHVKDDCGNITSDFVEVFLTDDSPVISNVTSPITLTRNGKYYVGNLQFQVNDPNSLIEAYYVGLSPIPNTYKSITRTSANIINHQVKIPENEIDGSKILYLQLRDEEGNLSNMYRIAIRIVDFKFEKFDIDMNRYVAGSSDVRVYFETNTNPLNIEYGYQVDNNIIPPVWNIIPILDRNEIGVFYFDFNLDVSTITNGEHTLYVWLRNKENEKIMKTFDFISEPSAAPPVANLSIYKTEYKDNKKIVWVQADVYDTGVGVQSMSLVDTLLDNFENINTIQTKRIIKKFEYDKTNNSTILYRCKLIDAAGATSIMFTTSVDLSNVY